MGEAIMNTGMELITKISHITEISFILSQMLFNKDQNRLMARLQGVTVSEIDPERGKAWRNRMIVRSRLKRYASSH
jgi:hypothetical protein